MLPRRRCTTAWGPSRSSCASPSRTWQAWMSSLRQALKLVQQVHHYPKPACLAAASCCQCCRGGLQPHSCSQRQTGPHRPHHSALQAKCQREQVQAPEKPTFLLWRLFRSGCRVVLPQRGGHFLELMQVRFAPARAAVPRLQRQAKQACCPGWHPRAPKPAPAACRLPSRLRHASQSAELTLAHIPVLLVPASHPHSARLCTHKLPLDDCSSP